MAKRRSDRISLDVTADVYVEDILDQLDDEALRDECKARGLMSPSDADIQGRETFFDLMEEMRDAFERSDRQHFEVLLIQIQTEARVPRLKINGAKKDAPVPAFT